jgi:hypothetical protein
MVRAELGQAALTLCRFGFGHRAVEVGNSTNIRAKSECSRRERGVHGGGSDGSGHADSCFIKEDLKNTLVNSRSGRD